MAWESARRSSPQQQHKYGNGVQAASMRCVLCGAPFRNPSSHDRVTACLTGPSSSFRWLTQWYSLPVPSAHTRKRGEPPAFFCHKDCCKLLCCKLNMHPQHEQIWPYVKEQMSAADSMPDSLNPASYLGVADMLETANNCSSTTMLSAAFTPDDSWMLHSPLVCTKNASRILTIWQPKLDSRSWPCSLVQRLSKLLLSPTQQFRVSPPHTPSTSSGGAAPAAQPDLLDIMLCNTALHHPQVVAKLHLTSKTISARLATALAGRLHLCFTSSSTESVVSLSMWLHQHAGLLSTLEASLKVYCCSEDEAGADSTFAQGLASSATHAPELRMRSFSTTYSKTQLLSPRCKTLPCLQHLTHLCIPDLLTDMQIHCLPPKLSSLEVTKSTSTVARLQLISQQCPRLQEVRLGYSLWPGPNNKGPLLLDHALSGWVLLPVVELRFVGCRLPRGFTAQSQQEPPYMSRAALGQMVNLPGLSRLVFDGCCVDAPVREFAAVLSKLRSLKALDLADPSGVLTAERGSAPRAFVDSTATILQAASKK